MMSSNSSEQTITISQAQLKASLSRLEIPVRKYVWIQEQFARTLNPQTDSDFRTRFNGFYRVRRNCEWQESFYGLMNELRDKSIDIKFVLTEIHKRTGRIEASFASKLVATIHPACPVIDSVVLKNLKLRLPRFGAQNRIELICDVYKSLTDILANFLASPQGTTLVSEFRRTFIDVEIKEMKILDLVLWQMR
jgi:hypothetical protein